MVLAYDISDFAASETAFDSIIKRFGNIDVLVSNAARVLMSRTTDVGDFECIKQLFHINFLSYVKISMLRKFSVELAIPNLKPTG